MQDKEMLFGKVINNVMILNEFGIVVEYTWNDLPNHNKHIHLDNYVIMPNHIHGIILINNHGLEFNIVGAGSEPAPTSSEPAPTPSESALPIKKIKSRYHGLPEIIRQFKTFSACRINDIRKTRGAKIWQRNYYEHIIRNEHDYNRIQKYIIENPLKWNIDKKYP
jgi:REP element-mobilizing transposase RayT